MNLCLTVESSCGEILSLLVLNFPKWLKSRLKTQSRPEGKGGEAIRRIPHPPLGALTTSPCDGKRE